MGVDPKVTICKRNPECTEEESISGLLNGVFDKVRALCH
jgi:hypothetical protein